MPSKYLGRMGKFELHAFTGNGKYHDSELAKRMHEIRYSVLEGGHPIYCTAVSPDFEKRQEHNPHDALPTTTHFVTINRKTGEIEYILSTAKDSGETYNGDIIGVPMENRFSPLFNGYPPGAFLDEFRSQFLRENYGADSDVPPMRIAELYRHVKNPDSELGGKGSEGARLGVYAAAYQHLVRDALHEDRTPSDLWVWDAKPFYAFYMYSVVDGVFRNLTINGGKGGRWIPTKDSSVKSKRVDGLEHYFLKEDGTQVTRNLPILFPPKDGSFGPENRGERKPVPMVDGLVDVGHVEYMIKKHPLLFPGEDLKFKLKERTSRAIICHRMYKDHHKPNPLVLPLNTSLHIGTGTFPWKMKGGKILKKHSLLRSDWSPLYETDF
ncbi:MAG: hypothetical protein V3U72_01065 [Candidatus Aenigmarchaeota archaeon]